MHEKDKIDEDIVRFFIWSVWNFFQRQTTIEPKVDPPYIFSEFEHDEYTGIIGVSGSQKGAVHFTMSKEMVNHAIKMNYGSHIESDLPEKEWEELRADFAGEMTNTIAGNVRNYLGEDFLISVPVVMKAPKTEVYLPKGVTGLIFPIEWNGLRSHLIVALEQMVSSEEQLMIN